MKWKNKGHEYDVDMDILTRHFREQGEIFYVFGAGIRGDYVRPLLEHYDCFGGFIDNDKEKQKNGKNKATVFSMEEYLSLNKSKRGLIVIAVDDKIVPTISAELDSAGLSKNKDYFVYNYFLHKIFPAFSVYFYDKLYVEIIQICLTERCTLRCKKCAHACYNVRNDAEDMAIDIAKKSADSLFSGSVFVREFVLIGGEPFLYNDMADIIDYIGNRYKNKMMTFSITTNGTIIPNDDVLKMCQKYNILIRISDYSEAIPQIKKQYKKLAGILDKYGVEYVWENSESGWMDYGFENVDRGEDTDTLIEVFDYCDTPCREIRGNKLYFCVMSRSVSENLNMNVGHDDYLDMDMVKDKKVIMEFLTGYSDKGYLDMCNYCNGREAHHYPIPIAEQLK